MRGQVLRRDPLTETKRKIIALEASKVKPDDTPETVYNVKIKEFAELCNIKRNGRVYEEVFAEIYELKTKAIAFVNEDGTISIESYLDRIRINRETASVSYQIPEALLPHFKMYAQFTKLDLLEYMPMRGQYALLLYELLMSWRKAGQVYYSLENLRQLLEVPEGAYPKNADLLRYVVYAPLDQINERTKGKKIKYELKYGYRRKIEGITFFIPKDKESPLEITAPTTEQLEKEGQTTIFDSINEQAATSSVLAQLINILGNENEASKVIKDYQEDYCNAQLKYTNKAPRKNPSTYLKGALKGDWAKFNIYTKNKKGKPDCPNCNGTGRRTRIVGDSAEIVSYQCECIKE